MDVIIGCTYSVIAESCEWCVVDDKGILRCVPTICMFFLNDKKPLLHIKGICIYDYNRHSNYECNLKVGECVTIIDRYHHWFLKLI